MMTVLQTIRLLVIIQVIQTTRCQDGFGEQDLFRFQQMASNDGQLGSLTGFNNLLQRDPNTQTMSTTNLQFNLDDDTNKNNNYARSFFSRSKKVYRIKNPFQQHVEETEKQPENTEPQDSGAGASNQYASMQYSLPPEDFLQKMRAENQYYQQTQMSTPSPNMGYTATPQPQYQYSTVSQSTYENNNQQNNQIPLEPKASHGQTYLSTPSPYQFSTPNNYLDSVQSTPSPIPSFLSTPQNNGLFTGTPSSSYVSSASPMYLSSASSLQSYVSSPLSVIQTGSPDYSRVTTTIGNNAVSYDNNDPNKKMQIDHYDYAGNGVRYPNNIQQQYQNEYQSTTTTTSSPYLDQLRESWQNAMNSNLNAAAKSMQDTTFNQYYPSYQNQQDNRFESNSDNANSETHRIGSMAAANNLFVNYVQPDNQMLNNLKVRTRDLDHESTQDHYSNGDFGWKLTGKKPLIEYNAYPPRYSPLNTQSEGHAVSQMNFHMDTSKPYNYDQVSKSATEALDDQEFAKAAAKAHERLKQQQQQQQQHQQQQQQQHQQQQQQQQQFYATSNYGLNNVGNSDINSGANGYYNNNDKQKNKYADNPYLYNAQNDLITASPYFLSTPRENLDNKPKQPFDHDKALKNIVPIDMSNVVGSESPLKNGANLDNNGRYTPNNYGKDQLDQNVRQYLRPVTDSFYKDKNAIYGYNIKTKSDDYLSLDNLKQLESNIYGKQPQTQESNYNQGSYPGSPQSLSYLSQQSNNYQDNTQSQSVQQQGFIRNQNQISSDIANILKFNDIPYKYTQNLGNDQKLHNFNYDQIGIPTPLPLKINQNVGSHQLDVTSNLLSKLLLNKQPSMNINRPEIDSQTGNLLSTINGFKVANPFNVDLKLVAEMLKGKPTVDDSHMLALRDPYNNPSLHNKFDLSQLQFLLKSENTGNIAPINEGLSALGGSSYLDLYNNGRFPYQGVKYSRSQEEEESLPIADASSTHPIGAVVEQDDSGSEREVSEAVDLTGQGDDVPSNFEETRPKNHYMSASRTINDRHRHPNLLSSGRHSYQRKYPKADVEEPYPLLKPPPPGRGGHSMKMEKHGRRRRVNKPKLLRIIKTEPLFEAGAEPESLETSVPILLRPPPPVAESKSDKVAEEATA
ncbi:unnamed protein product [Chrysodeixis includens]|uniref:Uncharacterized protein n=1 Tax=Chrysodeixis includens TaxID=689277 RepID=A0A9P0FZ89_CHRIL|nr:unnamed protein product [Chrysodeixis includens]